MKKWDRIIALCLVLGLILAGCGENTGTGTDAVYVDSVANLRGSMALREYKTVLLEWWNRRLR